MLSTLLFQASCYLFTFHTGSVGLSALPIRILGLTCNHFQSPVLHNSDIMNILFIVSSLFIASNIFNESIICLKKVRIKLGSLFWGHKSRLPFFLAVILLKVLWMEWNGIWNLECNGNGIWLGVHWRKMWQNIPSFLEILVMNCQYASESSNTKSQWNLWLCSWSYSHFIWSLF